MPAPVDPHAGHDMGDMEAQPADPHAGHDMSGMSGMSMSTPNAPPARRRTIRPPPMPPTPFSAPRPWPRLSPPADRRKRRCPHERRRHRPPGDGFRPTAPTPYVWDVQGWTGGDIHRFWWKTEGEGDLHGRLHEVDVQALYSRAISPFWNLQAGVRQDIRPNAGRKRPTPCGPARTGPPLVGDRTPAAFLSTNGDLTARVEAEYRPAHHTSA